MKTKIITDNASEKLTVKWDGERFAIIRRKNPDDGSSIPVILNPKEMLDLIGFAGKLGGE